MTSAGLLVLLFAWGVLPRLALPPFASHMTAHMMVVAIAAPLVALGVAGGRFDPARLAPRVVSPIPASMVEMVVVWTWHAPSLHRAARTSFAAFAAEQTSFLFAGVLLWSAVLGGTPDQRRKRALASVAGLLLTFMHMTLLGVLIALTPRDLYGGHAHHAHHGMKAGALAPVVDQQIGGAVMLLLSSIVYLGATLALVARVWRKRPRSA